MIVCLGLATLDTILVVPRHPGEDDRVVASERLVAGGGPAATAAVAAARLGAEVAFVGVVGDDEAGAKIVADLDREGIDTAHVAVLAGFASPQSVVLVGDGTRSIVASTPPVLELDAAAEALCLRADWVHVDHVGYAAAPPGVRLSVDGGNPIDGLDVDRVALYAPTRELDDGRRAALTVVTNGARGCFAHRGNETIFVPSRKVDAVSTLGAGDVFHGALVVMLERGLPLTASLERAAACAALSCRAFDGRSAIPTAAELEAAIEGPAAPAAHG